MQHFHDKIRVGDQILFAPSIYTMFIIVEIWPLYDFHLGKREKCLLLVQYRKIYVGNGCANTHIGVIISEWNLSHVKLFTVSFLSQFRAQYITKVIFFARCRPDPCKNLTLTWYFLLSEKLLVCATTYLVQFSNY